MVVKSKNAARASVTMTMLINTFNAQEQDVRKASETPEDMESQKAVRVNVTMTMLNTFYASCEKKKGLIPGGWRASRAKIERLHNHIPSLVPTYIQCIMIQKNIIR